MHLARKIKISLFVEIYLLLIPGNHALNCDIFCMESRDMVNRP